MKSLFSRLFMVALCAVATSVSFAQTGTAAHRTTTATSAAHRPVARTATGCATVPTLSSKIPPVPTGVGCPKTLYAITSSTTQLSPMLSAPLRESLEKLNQSFSMAYVDTKVGTGELAAPKMFYTVNYTGYLVDGTTFDSSVGKDPITFPYGAHRVIQGWDTGFEGMHVGGKRRLFVPYQLAYGEAGRPPVIPAKAELVFDIELVSQSDKPPTPKTPPTPPASPAGAPGTTGPAGTTSPAGPGNAAPATTPAATPGTIPQPAGKPSTPPVTSTTPTGTTVPRP